MPATKNSHPIRIKIYDINNALLDGATVSLTLGTETISVTSNSSGEAVLNVANAGSWSVGDSVSLTAYKLYEGTVTSTLVLTSEPQTTSLTLAQTSDLYYEESPSDNYNLNFALLTDFQGNKITKDNPLPVMDFSNLIPQSYDYISLSYTGSNITGIIYKSGGASGTTLATLTLTYDGSDNILTVTRS